MRNQGPFCLFGSLHALPSLWPGLYMEWTDRHSQALVTSADKTDSGY